MGKTIQRKGATALDLSWIAGHHRGDMNAIEATGIVDAQHQLRLDEPLPIPGQSRVRVIVLVPEAEDISEAAWTKAAADGRPFHDQG